LPEIFPDIFSDIYNKFEKPKFSDENWVYDSFFAAIFLCNRNALLKMPDKTFFFAKKSGKDF
jgi:hypothetical protein